MCPGSWEGKFLDSAGMHRSPFPLAGNLCCLWKARASKENVLRLTCAVGRNMLFRGGWGVGSRGPVISLLLPRYHPVLSGGQGSLYVNTSLPGSPGSGTGRRQRHEGTGFWGTNPHRNSSRGPTCVQGGKNKNKTPHPAHGKTPPQEESTPPRGKKKRLPHFHTPKTGVPSEGKNSPRCSKAQVQRRE